MKSIYKLFTELLSEKIADDVIVAKKIPTKNNYRIGKDSQGYPCILIKVNQKKSKITPPPISLENLTVLHNVQCKILESNLLEDNFTLIKCKSDNQNLYEYFLNLVHPLILAMGIEPTELEINDFVNKVLELFLSISESPKKSIQGLWSELFIISESKNKENFIESWHEDPFENFDFKFGRTRLEIKSTSGKTRKHTFNLNQLSPENKENLFIASLFIEKNPKGVSIKDLILKIQKELKGNINLLTKLNRIILITLGNEWKNIDNEKFDISYARNSLRLFNYLTIPCINRSIPKEVTDIHFSVDLTDLPELVKNEKRSNEFLKYL